ncbi:MAG: DUF721 domain-containing protein [Burkholderiales bacterium]|nr:DUF721 domain-containing protein [Burkholderiales bacterium]
MPARKLSEILSTASELGKLGAAAQRVEQLQRIYVEAVPAELSRLSHVGWARAGVLSITASNGAVAAKLRQVTPRVLDRMRRRGFEFNSMRIEVQVARTPSAGSAAITKPLSSQALSAIDAALGTLAESPLKQALARLARRR